MQIARSSSASHSGPSKSPAGKPSKLQATLRDATIDCVVGGLASTAGWGISRINPWLGIAAGAAIGAVAPRPAGSPYDQDGRLKYAAGALFGALCGMAGTFGGPGVIPFAAAFGAFRGAAGHALYPEAR